MLANVPVLSFTCLPGQILILGKYISAQFSSGQKSYEQKILMEPLVFSPKPNEIGFRKDFFQKIKITNLGI
jgi:hypothetical protein